MLNILILQRLFSKGIKRGEAPLKNYLPSPLGKGRGIKGEGLLLISSSGLDKRDYWCYNCFDKVIFIKHYDTTG